MLRKLIATVAIIAFSNVYGNAPLAQKNALNNAFNELEYTLTVEWDQQDQKVAQEALAAFEAQVKALQTEGLSNSDLIEGSLSKIKNQKTQEEIKALFEVVEANEMTSSEARDFVVEALKQGQIAGASWTGNKLKKKALIILAVFIVLISVVVVTNDNDDDEDDTEVVNDDDSDDDDECYEYEYDYNYDDPTYYNPCEQYPQ